MRLILVLLGLFLTGCTTTRSISAAQIPALTTIVQIGDQIDCTLQGGFHKIFKVSHVEATTMGDGRTEVWADQIIELKIKRFSATKTAVLAGGLAGVVYLGSRPWGDGYWHVTEEDVRAAMRP